MSRLRGLLVLGPLLTLAATAVVWGAAPDDRAGFHGELADGEADDSLAEFPSGGETAADLWALVDRAAKEAPLGRESVLGPDDRRQVYGTTRFPARAIGLLTFTQAGRNFQCSAFLVGRDTILTAGHCVHEGGTGSAGGWSTNVRFYPGRSGAESPFGSCSASALFTVDGWFADGLEGFDYGGAKLNCRIGTALGWLGLAAPDDPVDGELATIQGYPGDKPFATQWRHTGRIGASTFRQIFYSTDTTGGQSGSPIYHRTRAFGACRQNCAFGVHAYGLHEPAPHRLWNHGVRFDERVLENIEAWRSFVP